MALKPKTPLRRSFSEHVKDSTNKAWEILWRSAREKRLSEIEAKEACDWLRAAGFPQYAQLFKNCHVPIDMDWVRSDHEFLDSDTFDSLCRRLTTLNKCVEMKLDLIRHKRRGEVDDDMEPCAISPKWSYDRKSRCWIRTDGMDFLPSVDSSISRLRRSGSCEASLSDSSEHHEILSTHSSSSADSDGDGTSLKASEEPETSLRSCRFSLTSKTLSPDSPYSEPPSPVETRSISGKECFSEKPPSLKKGQSLIRKMDKLRFRRSTLRLHGHSGNQRLVIGSPVLQEGYLEDKREELRQMNLTSSPVSLATPYGVSSSSPSENSSAVSTPSPITKNRSNCKRQNSLSIAQERIFVSEQKLLNQHGLNGNTVFEIPHGHKPGTFPTILHHTVIDDTSVNWRTGSFHGYHRRRCRSSTSKDQEPPYSPLVAHNHRVSVYDNVPDHLDDDVFSALDSVMERITGLQQLVTSWTDKSPEDGDSDLSHSSSPSPSSLTDIHLEIKEQSQRDQNQSEQNYRKILQEWTNTAPLPGAQNLYWSSEKIFSSLGSSTQALESQLARCVSMLQRLSLLRLTVLMDKHSPFSKQGWNWTVPKVYSKMKVTEHKNRKVFGVPLLQSVQRSGKPLPPSILRAMEYLKTDCLDQVGLFRKSGVKSRIQCLREMMEAEPEELSFEEQSAFDVADMIKQYFRDLPEPIFSRKLCESFLHIYQYFPKDQQFAAVQAAIFLLPDENREALQCLLFFLHEVVAGVEENQMTPTNIAVCLAPSLFHLNVLRRDSSRGQRKYSLGRPDQRDLSENLAATQGLAHMITECIRLFQMPHYWKPSNCTEETLSVGCGIDTAESEVADRTQLDAMVQQLLRDTREKPKRWVTYPTSDNVDVAFKKVEDGSPLRLWRGTVDVDAQQKDVFQRVLREHSQWQSELQHSEVKTLDKDLEMYQFTLQAAGTRPPLQHLLLRTWQSDPSAGPLFVAATSAQRADVAKGGVTTRVLCWMFLVEATAAKKSRLTHFCRTDTGGRSVEWHNKVGGHLLSQSLLAIRDSFKAKTKGKL